MEDRNVTVSRAWRWAGLAAALVVYLAAILTFGLGFLLAPGGVALSVIALRRLPRPRGWLPWLGLAANAVQLIPLAIWILPALILGDYF
jgi:hypothetical protein